MKSIGVKLLLVAVIGSCGQVRAHDAIAPGKPSTEMPKQLENVGIIEKSGDLLDLNLQFKDEAGQIVTLSDYFNGKMPVILSLVYFQCANLCNYHLNGLTDGLKTLNLNVGEKFRVLSISIDPHETPVMAKGKKEAYLKVYGRTGAENGWHFLTGSEENIKKLAARVGFQYRWDPDQKQWAHASAAIVLTPNGRISRYLHGIMFDEKNLKLSLIEASNGKIGTIIDQIIFYCFQFDPTKNKFTLYAFNVMRIGAILMILILILILGPFWFRQRTKKHPSQGVT